MNIRLKNIGYSIARFLLQLHRPAKRRNWRALKRSGESLASLLIREAVANDIPRLARLHVQAWNETYPFVKTPPTYAIRESQWKQQFESTDGSWFCYVVENSKNELLGFAKGKKYYSPDLPAYAGELNKIYLLRTYQRLGLGRKLFCQVVKRFLNEQVHSMVLFGIPQNPSCHFHEAMGGEKLYDEKGVFNGGYAWKDLRKVSSICP